MTLLGVYEIENNPEVHLIEIMFEKTPESVDVGQITQKMNGVDKSNWQVPWDERYLDDKGERSIGEQFEIPRGQSSTRLIFFFHYLELDKPLLTQFGKIKLTKPTVIPERLKGIKYESPN